MACELALAEAEPEPGGGMMCMGGAAVSNLQFFAVTLADTNGTVGFTVVWPVDFTNRISLIAATDLLAFDWTLLVTTNVPSETNALDYVDSASAGCSQRFYHAYNADVNAATDPDGDGVTSGEELYLLKTDPTDSDDPPNAKGTVSYWGDASNLVVYSGGQTGPVYVVAVTSADSWSTDVSDIVVTLTENQQQSGTSDGEYHIVNVSPDVYWLKAFRDSDGNGTPGIYEATGGCVNTSGGPFPITNQVLDRWIVLLDPDTDEDGLADWWEIASFYTLGQAAPQDYDNDKLMNILEYYLGTDPTAGFEDADEDGMSDDWEDAYGLDKLDDADADEDVDQDGFTNLEEYLHGALGTDPTDPNSHPPACYVDAVSGSDSTGDGSYTNAWRSIGKGLEEAPQDGRVVVLPGTYTGADNRGQLFPSKCRMLLGLAGAEETVVDCENAGYAFQVSSSCLDAVVRGLTFRNGYFSSDGGMIKCLGHRFEVRECVFADNEADGGYGGAIDFRGTNELALFDCTFVSNRAANGGALYLYRNSGSSVSFAFDRCVFHGNSADYYGGAFFMYGGNPIMQLRNCRLTGNTAGAQGAVIVGAGETGTLTIASCTIADNTSPYGGALQDFEAVEVANSILWSNTPAHFAFTGACDVAYCDVQGWTGGGAGNITADPRFADSLYRLSPCSPCRNVGDNEDWMSSATDLFGRPRIMHEAVDIGAYELNVYLVKDGNPSASPPYQTWQTAAATIQAGIDAAEGVDPEVLVTNGVYDSGSVSPGGGLACRVALTGTRL